MVKLEDGAKSDWLVLKDGNGLYYIGQLTYHAASHTWFSCPVESNNAEKFTRYSDAYSTLVLMLSIMNV